VHALNFLTSVLTKKSYHGAGAGISLSYSVSAGFATDSAAAADAKRILEAHVIGGSAAAGAGAGAVGSPNSSAAPGAVIRALTSMVVTQFLVMRGNAT
jgi:hypothetical protein